MTKVSSGSPPWQSHICDVLEGSGQVLVICCGFPPATRWQSWWLGPWAGRYLCGDCRGGHIADPWRKPARFLGCWDRINFLMTEVCVISSDCLSQGICPTVHMHQSHWLSCSLLVIACPLPHPQALQPWVMLYWGGISCLPRCSGLGRGVWLQPRELLLPFVSCLHLCTGYRVHHSWTGPADTHLIHSPWENQSKSRTTTEKMFENAILGHCQVVLQLRTCFLLQEKLFSPSWQHHLKNDVASSLVTQYVFQTSYSTTSKLLLLYKI